MITLEVSMSREPVDTMESGSVFPQSRVRRGDLCQYPSRTCNQSSFFLLELIAVIHIFCQTNKVGNSR
jgi:hypothetical protein